MTLVELLDSIWRKPGEQMAWGRIAPGHVIGQREQQPFRSGEDYVVVRLGSMFLRDARILWLKMSPLAHATVETTGRKGLRTETAVIGPAQFGDLAAASSNNTVVVAQRLAGPCVWRGGDLGLATGLFAVSRDQAAAALLSTLGQLAGLGAPGLGQATQIANIVKTGVESILGLQGTRPVLGVRATLKADVAATDGELASPCVLVAIATSQDKVDFGKLWVKDGRLQIGDQADSLRPYTQQDHLLISVERGPPREDWRGLPALTPHEAAFKAALADTPNSSMSVQERANAAFRAFDADLSSEDELTEPDKGRIRGQMIEDLRRRIKQLEDPLGLAQAEARSVGGIAKNAGDPRDFDFLDVADPSRERAAPAAQGTVPFG